MNDETLDAKGACMPATDALPASADMATAQAISAQVVEAAFASDAIRRTAFIELDPGQSATLSQRVPGGLHNVQDVYQLSPLQEGMLFHRLLNEQRDGYVLSTAFELTSRADARALAGALQKVIDRHDALRSAVLWEGMPQPLQVVYRTAALPVEERVLEFDAAADPLEQLKDCMRPDRVRFDLQRAPLARLQIFRDAMSERCYALLRVHHLVCDHQSLRNVVREAFAVLDGRDYDLPAPVAYRDYVAQALAQLRPADGETFFRRKLAGLHEPSAPFELHDVHGDGSRIVETRQVLDAALSYRVRALGRAIGMSPARLFHAAWAVVVAHTSGREDVVYGTVFGARHRDAAAAAMVGMAVNTLPLRLRLQGITAQELVQQTHDELQELMSHVQVPLTVAQRCSGFVSSTPLFTALLNYRRSSPDAREQRTECSGVVELDRGEAWTNYPVTLIVDDLEDGFALTSQTDCRIEPQRVIGYLQTAVTSLLHALEHAPQTHALALSILPDNEHELLITGFNAGYKTYSSDALIHELFEQQVRRTPHAVAVVHEGQTLTYARLNTHANQLARYLQRRGVGPDELVALYLERGPEMVIGLLAILKAGAAYVPLDPNYPAERLAYLLQDSAPRVLVTDSCLSGTLQDPRVEVLALDREREQIAAMDTSNIEPRATGTADRSPRLAYVIYTSGSTGRPKGVMVEHRNVTRLFAATAQWFRFDANDVWTLFHSVAFDFSVWELWGALFYGGRVVVVPQLTARSPREFYDLLCEQGVTVLNQTPSAFLQLMHAQASGRQQFHSLRVVIFGGEALELHTLRPWASRNDLAKTRLVNMYGITETTVHVTYRCLTQHDVESEHNSVIGVPITDLRVYLLDPRGLPVPIGVPGEIYIGGAGVARGYLNRPELTAQRFVADRFSEEAGARMYRSGDLGRWRADGTLEYLGRNDDQVKIRGFRIELGEIEAQLGLHEQVKEAVVIAREDAPGEKRLVAYVVATGDGRGAAGAEELRAHLKAVLPEYMVPSAFVLLERLPMTTNGKLDRRALPVPELESFASRQYQPARGEVEEILAGVWQSLLRVERVGRQDNFFELGGHSLLIVQMLERLRRVGLSVEVRRVFETATLAELASALSREGAGEVEVPENLIPEQCEAVTPPMLPLIELEVQQIERIAGAVPGGAKNIQDIYPLAPLQEGILFHHLLNQGGGDTYVVPTLLRVASRERLEQLRAALQAVIDRHDILRTAVLWEQLPRPVQVVYRRAELAVVEVTLERNRDVLQQVHQWLEPQHQRLDPRSAPLMRLQVAQDPFGSEWFVLVRLHHIAGDNASQEIIVSEVISHLEQSGQQLPTPIPYRNHVAQALAYARRHDAEGFFRGKLADIDEPTAPFGLLDVHGDGTQVEEAREELPTQLAQRVRTQARRLGVSAATLFHAAWGLVVARTSGRDDIVFGSVLLGRLQGQAGAQRILGMFINTLPLRLQLQGVSAKELVEQTQRGLVELLSHEQASLAVAQRCSGIAAGAPLFSALLNYRHSTPNSTATWSSAPGISLLAIRERTNYPITLSVDDIGNTFALMTQTDRRVDPRRLATYLSTAMQSLVEVLEQTPQTPALALSILPQSERQQILESFNATSAPYPREKLIHQLFEEQVARTPDAPAVEYAERTLTYSELNGKANQLARYLQAKGVVPDEPVGICVERSPEMVIGLLGILKAGGAYVPLDPDYPPQRLLYMLQNAHPRVLITQQHLEARLPQIDSDIVAIDSDWPQVEQHENGNIHPLAIQLTSRNLAYVIYTSGSTGEPKGAMNEHRALINRLTWMQDAMQLECSDRVLQKTPFSFDVSVWEFFWTLMTGARLIVARPQGHQDPTYLRKLIDECAVTTLHFVPSMLQVFLEQHEHGSCTSVRRIVCSGEELSAALRQKCLECLPDVQLWNLYGPTEAAVDVTAWRCATQEGYARVPIGRPIANTQMYVLDQRLEPVPTGIGGELYIGGDCVGRGYFGKPDLTAERFVVDPFSADPQARLYRTGDVGRWRADGAIEYLGRNDNQVKIRGLRIELGDIEAQLVRHAQVREAVVVAREEASGGKSLVAYVTPRGARVCESEELRRHLKAVLPEYMLPNAFVVLESLPLTPNGKVDRRALPEPVAGGHASREYAPPDGEIENAVAQIWRELLRMERIGRADHFFELGGHSLLAVQALARLQVVLSLEIPIKAIFEWPTLKDFSAHVAGLRHSRLLARIAAGGAEVEELLESLASISDGKAQSWLKELGVEGRP